MRLEQAYAALRFDPTVPPWLLAALAVVCLLVLLPAALKRARGTVWRALAFAVLLLWLAGPRLVQETRETLRDIALLVLDESASMAVGERAALRDAARARLTEAAGRLPDLDLRTITVPEAGHDPRGEGEERRRHRELHGGEHPLGMLVAQLHRGERPHIV